jgi:Ca2+-binding RTX toxin-like protein
MTILKFRGDQIGEALQFDANNATTAVEIGRRWFAATDTVEITFAAGSFNATTKELTGGAGAVIGFKVTTAAGQVTTFGVSSANALDVDPDNSKNGAGFFYISETPKPGIGGAYAGLLPEKMVVTSVPLTAGTSPIFDNIGGFIPDGGSITPISPAPLTSTTRTINGTAAVDQITGTSQSERINSLTGADVIKSQGGNDVILGGDGNDVINAGAGNDLIHGGNGSDNLTGSTGADLFMFGAGDTVLDFKQSQGDQIIINAQKAVNITFRNGSAILSLAGENGSMTIRNVNSLTFNAGVALEYGNIAF